VIRTGHKEKARVLYGGAAVGVLASFALFFVVRAAFDSIPAANREILEGATTLLAVVVLFYVSYWLINKIETAKWNRFIQGKMKGALLKGSASALAAVAFLAVFREGFETVIFYQGLYGAASNGFAITAGVLAATIVLAIAFFAFYKLHIALPLRPFFIVTSILLYYLADTFTGVGVHELQEAGVVPTTIVPWVATLTSLPVLSTMADFLGVFPTFETLAAHALLGLAIVGGLAWTFVLEPRRNRIDVAEA
jgi:high-affinity iron transporter